MNNLKNIMIILFIFLCSLIFADDVPKRIIVIEENLELDTDTFEKKSIQNNNVIDNQVDLYTEKETKEQEIEKAKNLIVVDDIPKEYNDWYGILSSEQGGLGWLMWGNTNSDLAVALLEKTNFSPKSQILSDLTSKLLMSRAQKPKEKEISDGIADSFIKKGQLQYLKKKIKVLAYIGDTENINRLVENIPLEVKGSNFDNLLYELRQFDKDIPYICDELQKKKFDLQKDIEKRKTLIACIIARKNFNKAQLALELLENDSVDSLNYIQTVRKFLEEPSIKNLLLDEESMDIKNFKIISLSNYDIAKNIFSNDSITFNKIIYDMKLYSTINQVESLEKLVSLGFYSPNILKNVYEDYYTKLDKTEDFYDTIKMETENSLNIRVSLYHLINNSVSDIERAKLLNLLWLKSKEIGIEKAIYFMTSNSINSLVPKRELSWFIYPATEALISVKEYNEAKNWLFFMTNDFKDRATLDINFCKMLLLLYIADADLVKSNYDIPDINFLLKLLDNSLNIKKQSIYSLMVTLKALNYEVSAELWENFYINEYIKFNTNLDGLKTNLFLILEESVKKGNLAEVVLLTIDLLNTQRKKNIDYYIIYKAINALNDIGLRKYARNFGLEINLDI
tara:strand:- start:7238 stop:9106 length:1869 start_codon:yes stop_codon:yes gene_type:complete